jgi:hypothetical protein
MIKAGFAETRGSGNVADRNAFEPTMPEKIEQPIDQHTPGLRLGKILCHVQGGGSP